MRLFFGISLPDEIRSSCAARATDAAGIVSGRYQPASNYHITLAFLGEVAPHRLSDAQSVLSHVCARFPSPVLSLGETGYFGRPHNGILIIRVHAAPPLLPLHDALVRALDDAGLPRDPGPFSPHVTLARHAHISGVQLPAGPAVSFSPACAHLYLSARNEENILTYTPLFFAPFAHG